MTQNSLYLIYLIFASLQIIKIGDVWLLKNYIQGDGLSKQSTKK